MKFGLRNITLLLKSVGNPERRFRSLHVAGTNGKGSTSAFLASVFIEGGYKTGLYTSPHLVRFTERIRINGVEIAETRLVEYARRLRPLVEQIGATFFEATTCIAFQYFADECVDVAVVEVGLGGRLDSTNVLRPMVSVITNVSLDHTEYLGDTVVKIAREKGGIIKRNIPCVTAAKDERVVRTLQRIASRKHSRLLRADKLVTAKVTAVRNGKSIVRFRSPYFALHKVLLGLAGEHQVANATAAIATLNVLMQNKNTRALYSRLSNSVVQRGLESVTGTTGLRARLEKLGSKYIFDVAHNPDGMQWLVSSLKATHRGKCVAVFGVLKDKDYREMCRMLAMIVVHVVAVRPSTKRGLPASSVVKELRRLGVSATNGRNLPHAIAIARRLAKGRTKVLVTGSHYVVGEALAFLERADA